METADARQNIVAPDPHALRTPNAIEPRYVLQGMGPDDVDRSGARQHGKAIELDQYGISFNPELPHGLEGIHPFGTREGVAVHDVNLVGARECAQAAKARQTVVVPD